MSRRTASSIGSRAACPHAGLGHSAGDALPRPMRLRRLKRRLDAPARRPPARCPRFSITPRWDGPGGLRPLPGFGEEFFAVGKAVGLEEEAEDERAVGRYRLVLVAGGAPDELA